MGRSSARLRCRRRAVGAVAVVAVAGAVVLAVTVLSPRDDVERVGDFDVLQTVDGSSAVLRPPPRGARGGHEALVRGQLAVVDGGCLGFRYDDGSQTVVVWPSTTTALPDEVGLEVPGFGTFRLGDSVEGSGGYTSVPFEGLLAGCPATDVAFLNEEQS